MTKKSIDLQVNTDPAWVQGIVDHFDVFLQDHANCERKASALAMSLVVKYPDRTRIIPQLIALAQEELGHFQQVYRLLEARGLLLSKDTQDPYVNQLLGLLRSAREERFLDRMLIASLIECRGAERFRLLSETLEDVELKRFYRELWASEAKHGHQFVDMILHYFAPAVVYSRLHELAAREAEIIQHLTWRPSLH
jgi:tRNA-(ms[2]io[6]A)-hydroxylase